MWTTEKILDSYSINAKNKENASNLQILNPRNNMEFKITKMIQKKTISQRF
jgi:hypothetical protein